MIYVINLNTLLSVLQKYGTVCLASATSHPVRLRALRRGGDGATVLEPSDVRLGDALGL